MARARKRTCRRSGCNLEPVSGGFCREHALEEERLRQRERDALTLLHESTVDGELPSALQVRAILDPLRERWYRVCDVVNNQIGREDMPLDEADGAKSWCIALAAELVDAHRAIASGQPEPPGLSRTRAWVDSRFENLERGLMSNGEPRS